ncbi:MAG: hypothetical protein U0703_05915 [Anaerolineae bacterium]
MRSRWLFILLLVVLLALMTSSVIAQDAKDTYHVAVIRWSPDDIYFNGVQLGQELERQRIMEEDG